MKHLYDEPDERKSHDSMVPTLGGVALFAGVIFSFTFWSASSPYPNRQYIISSLIIMFFIGLKDDIVELSPVKKFIGQLVAAGILVFFADFRLTNMVGILGIYEIPYNVSCILTMFTILLIINAYNLIDGIDGLAAGIGIIASTAFGIVLFMLNNAVLAGLSFALSGALLAFLWFNLSPAKIFMGDTGSLVVGLILSILAITFIETNINSPLTSVQFSDFIQTHLHISKVNFDLSTSAPAIAVGFLIIPLFDTLRVFMLRAFRRKSPFLPDRNHIHHKLLELGLNHKKASFVLYSVNIFFVILALLLRKLHSGQILLIFFGISMILSQIPTLIINYRAKNSKSSVV